MEQSLADEKRDETANVCSSLVASKLYNKFEQLSIPMAVRLLLLLATLLALILPTLAGSLTVQSRTGVVNQNSVYFFLISDTTWTNAGTVQLVFQSPPYSFTNTTGITGCIDPNTNTALNCYASSASTIAFSLSSTMISVVTQPFYLQLTLLNPPYVDNFTVTYNFVYPNMTIFSTLTGKVSGLYADSLTACSLAFTPSSTNSLSVVTVSITTKNSIPAGGSLQLVVNNFVTSDSTPTVNVLSNGSILNSTAAGSSSGQNYFFSRLFSNNVPAGSIVSFSLSSLTTPPTTQTSYFNYYLATTYTTLYLNTIDNSTCTINTITDYPIANLLAVPSPSTSTFNVGSTMQVNMDFTSPVLMNFATDTISITTDSSSLNYLTINTLTIGLATINLTGSGSLSIINITNGLEITTTAGVTIPANSAVKINSGIRIKAIMNSGAKNIFVKFFRSGYSYASGTCTVSIAPNTLQSASFTSLTATVSQLTIYTFTVRIKNALGVGAGMTITLPSDLWIATGTCTIGALTSSIGGSLSSSPTCTATSNTVIKVGNITASAMTGNVTLTVPISNIRNPISIQPTGSIFIQTFFSLTELTNPVDNSTALTGLTVTATPLTISTTSFAISRNNTANLKYAIYTVSYTVNSRFKANGYIKLTLPASVTLSSSPNVAYTLTYTNGTITTSQTIPTTSTLTNGNTVITFNFSNLVTADLSTGTIFTITVNSILNYPSFKPINPQISTYTSDNYLIEQSSTTAQTLTNTVEDTSLVVASTTASRINGKSTTCTFQLISPAAVAAGNLITAELQLTSNVNTQMYLASSLACQIGGVTVVCSADAVNTLMVKITTAAISANTAVIVSISGIILSRSLDQPGSIFFRLFQVSGSSNYNITSATLVPPINNNPNVVITTSLSINEQGGSYPSQLNQVQLFSITFTSTNRLQPGDIVVITVPSEYQFLGSTVGNSTFTSGSLCTASSSLYCSNNNSSPNQIRIVEKINGNVFTNISSLTVTINNSTYRSPQQWTTFNTNPFLVNTYSISGQTVDSVQSGTTTNATFYLACANSTAHCKTCTGGLCNSCYQVGDGNDTSFGYGGYFYLTSTKECVTACGANFFNQSNVCVQCTAPCYSCSTSATFCNSCVNSTYKLYNNSCPTGCPNAYYADSSNVCQACSANCFSCSLTSSNCTACNGLYLSAVTSSCVIASGCASTTYPDSSTFVCTSCSASCVGCTGNSTMCKACSTGFIINTAYNTNGIFPAQCTDQCPSGTANDTTNSLGLGIGCRCNASVCATCTGTVNSCLTCITTLVLLNTTCLSSCGSGYFVSSGTCSSCPSGCSSCSSSTICTGCTATGYWIYQGYCVNVCPSFTSYAVSNGSQTCISCSSGCTACQTASYCTTCLSPNYIESSDVNNQYCTSTCSSGKNVMGSRCSATCDSGYTAVSGVCQSSSNSTSTSITTTLTSTSSRIIPFPVTIALSVLSITAFASKVALPFTIVSAALAAFSGSMQVLSWFIFIIAVSVDASASDYPTAKIGLYIVLVALVITWILNAISLYFFKKYIWPDDKFQTNLKRLRKTKTGVCVTYTCLAITAVFSHKFIQILFCNLFEAGYFLYKVQDKIKFTPLNYIRYVSLSASVLALIGAGIANFQYQSLSLGNVVFMQSIDLLIVTILAGIACLWATARKSEDYEKNIVSKHDIQQELDHDPIGDEDYHEENEMKGGNTRSKYIHKSTQRNKTIDPKENPIPKRGSTLVGPTGEDFNVTNIPLDGKEETDMDRVNLQDMSYGNSKNRKGSGLDMDDIALQESLGDDLIPNKPKKGKSTGKPATNRYSINNEASREDAVDNEQAKEKLKLKNNIENTLTNEQIEKTKVIKQVDKINTAILAQNSDIQPLSGSENYIKDKDKNELKQKQLSTLSGVEEQDLDRLPNNEREKAGQIKTAMSLLEAKKINIREYLKYLDIIEEEEDEHANSDDYEQKPKRHLKGNKKHKNQLGKSKTKPKPDRTARKVAADLVISQSLHPGYDEEMEPEIPDINLASVRARKHADSADNSDEDNYNRSHTRKNKKNNSDQHFMKNKLQLDDLVLVSLESGENYDRSLGEQFQRGNALHPVDKDELPPTNMYATEKMQQNRRNMNTSSPIGKNRMVPNPLISNGDHIDFLQSEGADQETIKNDVEFHQDISPSQFNQPNMRISNDEVSEAPTKPKLFKKDKQTRISNEGKVLQVQDMEDMEEGEPDEFNHVYEGDLPAGKMNRYNSSRMLDYDQILYNKRQNEKMKRLQQIYLPRLDVHKTNNSKRKRNNYSTNSERRKDDK